jgi:hypothetical protein
MLTRNEQKREAKDYRFSHSKSLNVFIETFSKNWCQTSPETFGSRFAMPQSEQQKTKPGVKMKLVLMLLSICLSGAAKAAECLCKKEVTTEHSRFCNTSGDCTSEPYQKTRYVALAIISDKEYRLEDFTERKECLVFLDDARECK